MILKIKGEHIGVKAFISAGANKNLFRTSDSLLINNLFDKL